VAVLRIHERVQVEVGWISVVTGKGLRPTPRIMNSMHDRQVHPQHVLGSIGAIRPHSSY
jgi:hypothetical protein